MIIQDLAEQLDLDRMTTGKNSAPTGARWADTVTASAKDRRSREIALTAEGQKRLTKGFPLWAAAQEKFEVANGRRRTAKLRQELGELRID